MRKVRIGLVLATLALLSLACGSGDRPKATPVESENDAIAATREFYQNPEAVFQALQQTMNPYGFVVTNTVKPGPDTWSLSVKKTVGNVFPEDVTRFVVQGAEGRPTRVHIMIRTSFFTRWPDEPDWTEGFFTSVFENIQ